MKDTKTKQLILGSLFIAMGAILPVVFHTAGLGRVFLPMHIPVLLAGIVLGWKIGGIVGFLTPYVSSIMTSMPPLFPTAFVMSFELASYAITIAIVYRLISRKTTSTTIPVYIALFVAMILGRFIYGAINAAVLGFMQEQYGFTVFLTSMFVESLPGILLQILLVPPIIFIVEERIGSSFHNVEKRCNHIFFY